MLKYAHIHIHIDFYLYLLYVFVLNYMLNLIYPDTAIAAAVTHCWLHFLQNHYPSIDDGIYVVLFLGTNIAVNEHKASATTTVFSFFLLSI